MKYYEIRYGKAYDEQTMYLDDDHENLVLKGLSENTDDSVLMLVGDFEFTTELGIEDYGKVWTEMTPRIREYILNCGYPDEIPCTLYAYYTLEEKDPDDPPDYFGAADDEYLEHVTEDEWLKACASFVGYAESMTEEDKAQAERMASGIRAWMEYNKNKQAGTAGLEEKE